MTDDSAENDCVGVIRSLNRIVTPEGIELTRTVELGGVPQVVSVRGSSRSNPVLLFVHGGPGTPLAATGWMWQRPLEEFFTVVHYDQRGAGRSFRLTPADRVRDDLDVDRYAQDAIELTRWLCRELDVPRIAIAGHSWGTVVATHAVLRAPELFDAYLGVGQVVNIRAGEGISYTGVMAEAQRRADEVAAGELAALAPYPGDELDIEKVIVERKWVQEYGGFAAYRPDCDYYMDGTDVSPDYNADDVASTSAGNRFTGELVLPQLLDIDLTGVRDFQVPVVQFLGRHDLMTPAAPVADWMAALEAPRKAVEWFENSAHMAMYEEPGHFLLAVLRHLKPAELQ